MSAAGGADIFQRIKEWNATRLDLFKISEPNKRNEFTGIVRFYFQGEGSKYQSKCLRISNLTTACQLVNVLVEKFHPDLKMLTAGRYALYEYHSESGERRLGANEAPLVVQLNWAFDEREGRFILRDESKPLPTARRNHALDNQPSSLQNGLAKSRSAQKLPTTAEPENSNKNSKGFARRWSSASRKKKRKNAVDGDADGVPDTTFTRTLSNPDEVLRRRREQRAHNRANGSAEEKGNTLKIYGDSLNKDIPFVTLQLSMEDTADSVVYWTLEKYGMAKMVNPLDFCIVQVNIPPRGEKLPIGLEREQTLHNQDCPLAIRSLASARDNISCVFQIRYRHGPSRDGRPAAPPPPPHPRAPPGYTQLTSRPTLPNFDMRPRDNMPYLMEIVSENQQKFRNGGLFVPLGDLFRRTSNVPLKLGTIEKMVGPLPNILVDKFLHPDVRPVHCTFTAVLASESKTRMPKTARPGELESMSHVSLLISPSLDGFAKPPGPAQIRLNGTRIVGPALVPPDSLLHLGKSLFLKFINPQAQLSPDEDAYASEPVKLRQTKTASDLVRKPQAQEDQHQKMAPEKNHNEARSQHMNGIRNPGSYEMNHQLPLSIEVRGIDISSSDGTLSKYIQLVDLILVHAHSEVQSTNTVIKPENRPSPFPLSPSYSLYLVYRAYQDQTSTLNFSPAERENNISYLTNYISTRIFESVPNCNRDANDQLELVYPFVYWMANSSELLHFLKNDMDLVSPGSHPKMALGSPQSPVHVCRQALHMLADSVDQCFYQLRSCMTILLQPLLYPLIYPGDIDLQDDVRQDDRPLSAKAYYESIREPNRIQPLMQLLSLLMQQLRRTRMNVSLTIQLFSQLFHGISAYIFNHVLINTEAKPRNARDDSNIWLTRLGATRLTRRLDRIKQWAQRQGLERAAECHLQRCTQACQLILVDRSNLDEFYQFCMDLLSLNSMQLEWLLAHLADPPPVPDEWIDLIVTGGKEVNDRALTDEMQHYPTSADGDMGPVELQLTEPKELPLPLLLPPDGYASDAVLTGAPTGLSEFLRPLSTKGLIHVKHNPVGDKSTNPYPWSNCLCLNKVPPNGEKSGTVRRIEKPHPKNEQVNNNNNNRRSRREQQQGREDSDLSDESDDSEDSEPGGHTQRFKPRTNTMRSSANRMGQRQHQSLPDLTVEDFDVMARDANVPVNSIIRFYLKKINNSLGLSIVAAKAEGERLYGIYVKEIVPGGAADRDGRLTTGDQILAIGSTSLIGCAQSDAVGHLAKQSRTDEGILLTIAKGSARHHHILELVRSSDPNLEGPKQLKNGPIAKPRNASQPPASNASELPFDKRPGGLRKIGTPVLPPSTQVGLKPATQQRQMYDQSDGNRHTQNGSRSDRDYKKKSGSLSRSTPSLNLAQVGIEDDSQSSDEYEQEIPKLRMTNGKGDSEHRYRDSYQDADEQLENFSRTKSAELSGRRGVPSDRRARILSPGSSQTPSSGSDIVNDGPFPNTNKNRESAHKPNNRRSPARPRDDQPDHGMYGPQGSQSQPNISKVDMPHDPIRHCSLSAEPDRDMANHQLAESVSDIFSSLGSVSSEHTPCSLHDSGNEQPVDLREQRLRPERDGSRERMYAGADRAGPNGKVRHPPPPAPPTHRSSQALTRDGRSNRSSQRYASESELVNPSGPRLGNPDQNRPKSALQRLDDIDQNRWQENDKDPENKRATWAQENMNGNYNKLPPAGNHFRPRSLQRSLDAINVQSMDGNQRTTINTPATSGSMTPTSVDTVISNPYQGSVTPGTDGPMPSEVFDTNKPVQYGSREKIPAHFGSSDMSHLRPQPTPSSPADDGVSETLMPPPHAVVSGTRWEENQLPSFAPELLPDVPVLQKNPNHGRTKTASEVPEPKKSEAIHFVQSTVVSAPDPGTNSDYTTRMKSSDSSMNNRPPLSKSSYFNQKPAESAVPSNYRRPESYTPIPMSNEVGNRPSPGAFPSTVLTASPPPTPTAEYPQYHPPDRLQPADWSTYTSSSVPEKSHLHSVPQTAPKPNSVAPFSYHLRPETHQIRVRSPSPARYEGSVSPRPELGNAGLSTTHTQHVTQPPLSAAARVAQLESEIASMEAKQNISGAEDINPTLDRLRVELQFQRRLADRESSRIHSTSIMETQPDLRNDERISSIREVKRPVEIQDTTNRTSQIWEQKRTEAERELENTQNRRLAELEQEHRAMLMRQEQRAKERSEWLEKHQNRSEIVRNGTKDDYSKFRNQPLLKKPSNEGTAKPSDSHVRYGRPKFDATQQGSMTTNFAPQYPIQSRLGPQVVESELPRSSPALITGDSQRVKKSVSFDKNLEIISVYSPPGTPQESLAENPPSKPLHGLTNSRLPQADRPTNPSSSEYYSRSYATNDLRHLDTEKVTTVPKSKSSMSISRTAGPSVIQSGGSSTSSVNPVPDAELLPFKEKMRLFAQQIGEELPKERSRMSNRQRELLQNPTSAKFGTRPVPVYNDPRSSDFLR